MTWSYSGNPANSNLDKVRFLVGDTDSTDPLLQDEEINFLVLDKGSVISASMQGCLNIMAKLARKVDYTIGPERVAASKRFDHYQTVMDNLRKYSIGINAAPSYATPSTATGDTNPIFDIGMHDATVGGSELDGSSN